MVFALLALIPTSFGTGTVRTVDDVVDTGVVDGPARDEPVVDGLSDDEGPESGATAFDVFGVDCAHALTVRSSRTSIAARRGGNRDRSIFPPRQFEGGIIVELVQQRQQLHAPPARQAG